MLHSIQFNSILYLIQLNHRISWNSCRKGVTFYKSLYKLKTSQLGAEVVLTDKESLIQLLEYNINNNFDETPKKRIEAKELLWGTPNPFKASFDMILGAGSVTAVVHI